MAFDKKLLLRKIEEAGITQVELAKRIQVTPRTVNRWLRGDKPPKAGHIRALAENLHCRPEAFDPRYADGDNEIHVEARVSAASHNAFAAMKLVYGADEQTIIELAPVLFSIVAARAVNLPKEDQAWWEKAARKAESLGLPPLQRFNCCEDQEGFAIDEQAARDHSCFGLESEEPGARSRNLFVEAMRRMAFEAGSEVSMERFASLGPGAAPTASGFIPHSALFDFIAEGDAEIVRGLADGDVRLSTSIIKAECHKDISLEGRAEIIRKDLAEQAASHRVKLTVRREESLRKLAAWRSIYQERYPNLAKEYDDFVAAYCKPEGWYPDYYDDVLREAAYVNPFAEIRFIDSDLLSKQHQVSQRGALWLSFNAPETRRFQELKAHRSLSKAEFGRVES